jgi:hypothetical protein
MGAGGELIIDRSIGEKKRADDVPRFECVAGPAQQMMRAKHSLKMIAHQFVATLARLLTAGMKCRALHLTFGRQYRLIVTRFPFDPATAIARASLATRERDALAGFILRSELRAKQKPATLG